MRQDLYPKSREEAEELIAAARENLHSAISGAQRRYWQDVLFDAQALLRHLTTEN